MPDYNRKAAVYWWSVVAAGVLVIAASLWDLLRIEPAGWIPIGLATIAAMFAGLVPIRIPRTTNSFTAGEMFVFLVVLTNGPEAAALASAAEAGVGAFRTSKRWTSRIASPAMAAVAMYSAGSLLHRFFATWFTWGGYHDVLLLLACVAFALCYFIINTVLMTMVPRLKRNERLRLADIVTPFSGLAVAYAGNACVATFLYLNYTQSGFAGVAAAVPIILILLTTGHYFLRRQEAEDSLKRATAARIEAAEKHMHELETSEQRFHGAFTHAAIGMALVTATGEIRQTNEALKELLGLPEDGALGLPIGIYIDDSTRGALDAQLARLRAGAKRSEEVMLRCKRSSANDVWITVNCSSFVATGSKEECFILQAQDISARRMAESRLQHIAFHDALTGLPNRQRFVEHLSSAIEWWNTDPQNAFAVMFLDFDRFKLINDSMGHTIGDEFLVHAARRIERTMRTGDVVSRLGGDEFAVLLRSKDAEIAVVSLAERLLVELSKPFTASGLRINTSASIGITFSRIGYVSPEEVLRDADTAMYKAKGAGKARFVPFDVSMHDAVAHRVRLESDLRTAIDAGALSIEYQPLIDLATGMVTGFEALARWDHPELGRISPAVFIPVAEESGTMVQLTDFILKKACAQLHDWQQIDPRCAGLTMHVNVAANDLVQGNLVERVSVALLHGRIRAEHLTIELTENILMAELASAMDVLHGLHGLGVHLSVDDFGTGYSSLSHLSTLPIDSLKIDRSFVNRLTGGSKEAAVIQAIASLGQALGKSVVAEGIETQEQLELLRRLSCDIGQGYHFARPLVPAVVPAFVMQRLIETTAVRDASGKTRPPLRLLSSKP